MEFRGTIHRLIIIAGVCILILIVSDIVRLAAETPSGGGEMPVAGAPGRHDGETEHAGSVAEIFLLREPVEPGKVSGADDEDSWISRRYGLELRGTVAGKMAVVADRKTSREQILSVGQKTRDFTVESIGRNRLVISGNKGRETLILPRNTTAEKRRSSPESRIISRNDLAHLLGDVDRLAGEISLQAVRAAAGGLAGYRVVSLKPMGTLAAMGLRKNDLLKTINGQMIRTPEDVYRVLESAVHQNTLTVTIRRNSRDRQLHYQIR